MCLMTCERVIAGAGENPVSWKANGWDIMLQCVVCRRRSRRHRSDYNGAFRIKPPPTVEALCGNCTANAGNKDTRTTHFVDYATAYELARDTK